MKRCLQGYRLCGRSVRLSLLISVALLLLPAAALAGHPPLGAFGSANEPSFTEPLGLAVDQSSGDLLVIDGEANTISRWHADGTPAEFSTLGTNVIDGAGGADETPQGELSFGGAGEVQIAVDNSGGATDGDIYVPQANAPHVVDVFTEDGTFLGQLTEYDEGPAAEGPAAAFAEPCGVGVDSAGNVYVGDFSGNIHKYEPAANPPVNGDSSANFAFSGNCTLATGAAATEGFIFPARFGSEEGKVSKLDSGTGEEKYVVDPGPTTTVSVDPETGHVYTAVRSTGEGKEGEVREYDASGPTEAPLLSNISTPSEVKGIAVDGSSGDIYVSRAGSPQIEVWGPVLPEAITGAASVVGDSVTLHGTVSAAGGPPATCVFQYVEIHAEEFEGATSVPCSPAGPFTGTDKVAASAEVNGLPEGFFRFRLLASNGGESPGATRQFNTIKAIPGLPDGRAYELVSPAQKAGEVIPPEPSVVTLGGSCEDCLPGMSLQIMPMQSTADGEAVLFEGEPFSGGLASGPNEYISARGSGGWGTQNLSEPQFATILGQGYQAFSPDLSRGVLYQAEPALSPEAPTRGGKSFANLYLRGADGSLRPLVGEEPPNRDPGLPEQFQDQFRLTYAGANPGTAASAAFGHIVFQANDALTDLTATAPPAPEIAEAGKECSLPGTRCDLYEWIGGQMRLVNVLPGNASAAPGAVLGSGRLLAEFPEFEGPDVDHAISADGSQIFWSDEEDGQLYVRIDGKETKGIEDPGLFLTATPSGSKVLLSDGCLYDLGEEKCADLTLDESSIHQGGFEGILGASEDLSRVYFVDTAKLTGENAEHKSPNEHGENEHNLYLWEEGSASFIGTLVGRDNKFSEYGDWRASISSRTAQVSTDGSYLAFMSVAPLTGYDNAVSGGGECKVGLGEACAEVFEYAAAGSGHLRCASCNPSGQRPLRFSNLSLIKGSTSFPPFPQPGNLSPKGGGQLFFESQDVLSPRDTNGHIQDVYEWEPRGVGSCEREGGCVYLISSGTSANDSMFLDSTPSGNDAFFVTRQRLLRLDQDEQLDVYDARAPHTPGEAVGFPQTGPSPCEGETCKGTASGTPALGSAGSGQFSGPGNPPKHHKHHKHKKHRKRAAKRSHGGSK